MTTCNDGAQQATWCPQTAADTLPSVLGLLPSGPAWDGASVPGTTMNMFWSAISDTLSWVYNRLCAYMMEFFCDTADESLDQWFVDYGLPNDCDPYGGNLCAKATAVGGQDCGTYTELARNAGYAIECAPMSAYINEGYCGCARAGCSQLGLGPVWEPGFGDGTCCGCAMAGCSQLTTRQDIVVNSGRGYCVGYYTNGRFISWAQAYVWVATVDLRASAVLQGIKYTPLNPQSVGNAGNAMAGCSQVCPLGSPAFALCWLQEISPAHTILVTKVINY